MSLIIVNEKVKFAEGIIRIRRLPFDSDEEYAYWWLPETDGKGKILRPARMSEQEKERYQEAEAKNQIMNSGRTAVLSYIGSPSGSTTQWAQQFAVGTGSITATSPTDTTLSNEVYRASPTSFAVNGTLVDISVSFGATTAQATYTNAGLWGAGATATLSSGVLMTKALFSYTKGNFSISIDYLLNLL
jgi:hypothetical protein